VPTGSRSPGRSHPGVCQQELANAVGSVRGVIARTLASLRDDGFVQTERDRVRITEPDRPVEIAESAPWLIRRSTCCVAPETLTTANPTRSFAADRALMAPLYVKRAARGGVAFVWRVAAVVLRDETKALRRY
jgi:hypothetical protein